MLVLPIPPEHTFPAPLPAPPIHRKAAGTGLLWRLRDRGDEYGEQGTAPTGGFDPTLLKDFGIFKQIGGGGTRRVTDPWRLSCITVCLW